MSEQLAQLKKKGGGNIDVFDELVAIYPYVAQGAFTVVSYQKGETVQFQKTTAIGDHIQFKYQSPNLVFTALTDGVFIIDGTERQCTANTVILSASWQGAHSVLWRAKDN